MGKLLLIPHISYPLPKKNGEIPSIGGGKRHPNAVNYPFSNKTEVMSLAQQLIDPSQNLSGFGGSHLAPLIVFAADGFFGALFHAVHAPLLFLQLLALDGRIKLCVESPAPFIGRRKYSMTGPIPPSAWSGLTRWTGRRFFPRPSFST